MDFIGCMFAVFLAVSSISLVKCNFVPNYSEPEKVFMPIVKPSNWFDALLYCKSLGLDLASITSEEQNQKLMQTLKTYLLDTNGHKFWLGGLKVVELTEEFRWFRTHNKLDYSNFMEGQPNSTRSNYNEVEQCLVIQMSEGKWDDDFCYQSHNYFACEYYIYNSNLKGIHYQ